MEREPVNLVFILADQFRYDAIAAHGNPYISTPTLDQFIRLGINFSNYYSLTPTCIPARASLMSGLHPEHTGIVGYEEGANWDFAHQLGGEFAKRNYYAKAIGKLHVSPPRKRCGFHHVELHDGYLHETRDMQRGTGLSYQRTDDYLRWLKKEVGHDLTDMGLDCNSWVARPFDLPEKYHPTNWTTQRAEEFLETRDPDEPFFLFLSYARPHSPLDPPTYYFDMYYDRLKDIPDPVIGDWVSQMGHLKPVERVDSLTGKLSSDEYRRMLAGYYGLITHIDHQLNRFLMAMQEHKLLDKTIFVFASDHGDQLGDHGLFRKGFPYKSSIHIPLMVYDPGENIGKRKDLNTAVDAFITQWDILPSLIDLVFDDKVPNVDGESFKPYLFKKGNHLGRAWVHGEHPLGEWSNHFVMDKQWKYVWYTQSGVEQLFNIQNDPMECYNLATNPTYMEVLDQYRQRLIDRLSHRAEGFVENGKLKPGQPYQPILPINQHHPIS